MSNRITEKHLEGLVNRLNRITKSPMTYGESTPDQRFTVNIGHYHIDYAYGGAQLMRTMNSGGGVTTPLGGGHVPKRELYGQISAFISGIEGAQNV